jgi:uncharacterized protein (TIGR03086 family)
MTVDLPDAHARALANTARIVGGVSRHQLHDPTPDDEWDVEALLQHIVSGNLWVAPLVGGETIEQVGDRLDGDVLGDDFRTSYDRSAAEAAAAFCADGAMDAPCAVSYGPVPGRVYCGHRLVDVLVHGWDVAQATGGDTELPGDLVEACLEVIEPQLEDLEASGAFGTDHEVPAGASPQVTLLSLLGRGRFT